MKIHFKINNKKNHLILFVHGLQGSKETFFEPKDKSFFHENFSQSILNSIDVGYLEYHTEEILSKKSFRFLFSKIFKTVKNEPIENLNIEELSISASHEIEKVISHYTSVNFICHSMGGLIVKGILIKNQNILNKTIFYITLATPHRGTNIAKYLNGINRQVKSLEENSQIIQYLTNNYLTIKDKLNRHYYRATDENWVLPKENAFPIFDDEHTSPVECSHTDIAKPRFDLYLAPLIHDINKKIENYLFINKNQSNNYPLTPKETIVNKIDSLESKIDILLSNQAMPINIHPNQPINQTQAQTLNTELINLPSGYTIKDAVAYQNFNYYILLTKYDKTDNILIRYLIQNGIDNDFGDNGKLSISFDSNNCNMNKIIIDENDLYIVGESVQHSYFAISICKATLEGKINKEYANNGFSLNNSKKEHQYANASIILKNKNIITVGASFQSKSMFISCIDENGNFLKTFANLGTIESNMGESNSWANCICKYDDNSFIVAGKTGTWEIFVSKFKNSGVYDTDSFKDSGTILLNHFLRVEDLKVQSDGKILVIGVGNEGRIVRLHSNGKLDTSFACDGILEVITNERSEILTLELLEDDSFIVGGSEADGNSYHNAIIATYTKDGQYNLDMFSSGYTSFEIKNKTTLHKIFIHNKNYISALCNYNIDYSQSKRTKVGIRNFILEKT